MGALAPAILGQSNTVSTRNSKVLNTPLNSWYTTIAAKIFFQTQIKTRTWENWMLWMIHYFSFFYSPQTDFVWRQLIIDWEILKTPIRKVDQGAAETLETPEVAPQPIQSDLPVKPTRIDPQSLWINRLCLDSNSIQAKLWNQFTSSGYFGI